MEFLDDCEIELRNIQVCNNYNYNYIHLCPVCVLHTNLPVLLVLVKD